MVVWIGQYEIVSISKLNLQVIVLACDYDGVIHVDSALHIAL